MNRLLGIGAVAAVVVGFLSFKKGKMDFKLVAESSNPQGRPHCEPCAERGFTYYDVKTCGDCGYIMCERCFGDDEICKSCEYVECANCGEMESPQWVFPTPHGEFCINCRNAWAEDPDAFVEHPSNPFNAESKKLPPLEKAEITGIASGATMEGLETLLAAESIDNPWLSQKPVGTFICEHCEEENEPMCPHCEANNQFYCWRCCDGKESHPDIHCPTCGGDGAIYDDDEEYVEDCQDCDATGDKTWIPHSKSFEASTTEGFKIYHFVRTEIEQNLTESNLEELIDLLSIKAPIPYLDEGMEQAENMDDEPTYLILHLARQKAKFIEEFQADFPTTKKPNCKCGAILEWDNLRKAWYCISCPFNTYKAESTDKTKVCEECGAKIHLGDSSCPDCGIIPDGITDVPKGMRGIRRPPKKVLNVCQECWGDLPEEGPPLNCSYCGHYPICDNCVTDEMPYEAKSGKLTCRGRHQEKRICYYCKSRIMFNSDSFSASGAGEIYSEGGRMVSIEETTTVNYNWNTDPDETDADEWDIESQVEEKVQDEMYNDDSGSGYWSYNDSDGKNVDVNYEWDKTVEDGDEEHIKSWAETDESFSAESDGDKQLDLAVKRTKMSAVRTGLAITTFSIVMWNLWTNKKQEKQIGDIMDLV